MKNRNSDNAAKADNTYTHTRDAPPQKMRLWAEYLIAIIFTISVLVTAGWLFNIPFLKQPIPGLSVIGLPTAFSLILCIISYWLLGAAKKTLKETAKLTYTEGDDQIRTIFNAAPDAVIVIDEAGKIIRWNSKAETLFGWQESEAIGKPLSETIIPDRFREVHKKGLRHFLNTGEGPLLGKIVETCALTKSGTEIDIALTIAASSQIKGGYLFIGFIRDISGKKIAEGKFKALLDSAPDAMIITNEKGIIALINKQTETLFGYDRDELIGKPVEILIPFDFRSRHGKHRDKYFADPKVRSMGAGLELFAMRKDGTEFPVEISLSPLKTEEGLLVSASVRDIRQRKEAAEKLKRVEEQYRLMIDEVEDYAIILLDSEGIVRNWNKGAEKIKGYSGEEIIGKSFRIFYTKEDQLSKLPENLMATAAQSGKAIDEGWRVRKDRSIFWASVVITALHDEKRKVIGFTKVTRDITGRKKAEEKFRSLLDAAPDATVIVNKSGTIQMINQQTENLFGYSRDEIIGRPVEILIPQDIRDTHVQHRDGFFKAAKVRAMGVGIELNAVKKNSTKFPVEISLSPIQTEEGILVSASVRDITGRKNLENQLRKSNEELEAFTYSVSHDLRAPLRGIIGFTAILEEDYASKLDEEAKRITSVIKDNTLKMGRLIDDLLAFSRMGKKEILRTSVNTHEMVKEVITELEQQNSGQEIGWEIQTLSPVSADINIIRQVWINLISNAIKYSRNNEKPIIRIGSYKQDDQTVFYIKDNGVGFDEQYKHKLFKVFQRLHGPEEFEGTGIGLALAEKIVSRHGGKIWAESAVNEGAAFYFSLPVL